MDSDKEEEGRSATRRTLDSAFEIEEFEDVSLLLDNPLQPGRSSLFARIRSFFNFTPRLQGFKRLGTSAGKWCPEEEAGVFSRLFFNYMNSLINLGTTKHLVQDDLWDLADKDEAHIITEKFEQQIQKSKDPMLRPNGSVLHALWNSFSLMFIFAGIVKVFHDILLILGPEILRLLLRHLRDKESACKHHYFLSFAHFFVFTAQYYSVGIGLAVAMFLASALHTIFINQYFHILFRISLHIKSALVMMIYSKSLRITSASRSQFGIGKIVNLQSNDASKLWNLVTFLHVLWSAPLQILLVLFQLVSILGWLPSLGGFLIIVSLIPFTTLIGKYAAALRKDQMKDTDARVKATTEIVTGIKAIKLYAWEDAYVSRIQKLRSQELTKVWKIGLLRALSRIVYFMTPVLVSGAGFGLFVLQGKHLTADVAFPALAYFQLLRFPVAMLPQQIMNIIYGKVALNRIQSFMDAEEMDKEEDFGQFDDDVTVGMKDAIFSWPPTPEPVLTNISFQARKGQLIQIVGDVGCGKSSLLSALMGEMKKHGGSIVLKGRVAYTAQEPWIQNKTLKENILVGMECDPERYSNTISACALDPDLETLPGGDQTEIGEKGVNLSGGQKHRVALARACYSDADVYLLDDPLSAVDAHVGRHLFDKCILGLLNKKTRILVSHQLQFLPQVDVIIVMKFGRVDRIGTYTELVSAGVEFTDFELHEYPNAKADEDGKEMHGSSSEDGNEDLNNKSSLRNPQGTDKASVKEDFAAASKNKARGTLMGAENREVGRVKRDVYVSYLKAWGPSFVLPILLVLLQFLEKGAGAGQNWWLSIWTDQTTEALQDEKAPNTGYFLSIYYIIGVTAVVFSITSCVTLIVSTINASRKLYSDLVLKVTRLPMSFFDTQPTGRLINRFTSDTEAMDSEVSGIIAMAVSTILSVFFSIVVVVAVTRVVVIAILILGVLYYRIQKRYVATTREIKRLDSIGLSPIYSHFNESLQGLQTIRAFQKQRHFSDINVELLNHSNQAHWPLMAVNRWLSVRLDIMSDVIVFITALVVTALLRTNAGLAGLALTSALSLTGTMNWLIRQTTQLEVSMNAIERITEYRNYSTEKAAIVESNRPPDHWPDGGAIVVKNLWVRYREALDPVLKDLTFSVHRHEKIGVCGRTGSGKSTLMMALYRIVEPYQGSVEIDNLNVLEIGLHDLRKSLSLVPQDPVIFSGTIRSNLDPISEQTSDAYIWEALRQVGLHEFVSDLAGGLDATIEEGGTNLSVGQRQLLCMARALLRGSKILILDEATSNVDHTADAVIQSTIRSSFQNCTVLTIAHRLHTIIDYDRVMVLDNGEIVEFDSPQALMSKPNGTFSSLVQEARRKGLKKGSKSTVNFLDKVNSMIKDG